MKKLFGTDGVRGVANRKLTPELALQIGLAHGASLEQKNAVIVVGRDSRLSGPMLENAYAAGLNSAGVSYLRLGVVPTPAVSHAILKGGYAGGAMISASHNPVPDNGIKLFRHDGLKLTDTELRNLERRIAESDLPRPEGEGIGGEIPGEALVESYHQSLRQACRSEGTRRLKVVLDCAHGSACGHAEQVFSEFCQVIPAHHQADGALINVDCGSTHLDDLRRRVLEEGADLGLAFDGDADRCLAVDEKGQEVDGDQMMFLFARRLKGQGRLKGQRVVATVMSNLGLEVALKAEGIELERTQVGDRYVMERLQQTGAVLGGEQSGHILLLDRSLSGDGLLTGLMLVELVRATDRSLSELAGEMPRYPQRLVNVKVQHKDRLGDDEVIQKVIADVERRFGGKGRVLVRPSGTEPLVRVMAEASEEASLQPILDELTGLVEQRLN